LSGKLSPETVQNFVKAGGILGPLFLILLFLATYIFAPLSGVPIMVAGFYIYGLKSILYVSIAAWISYITNFWISRKLGLDYVKFFVGDKELVKLNTFASKYGYISLFVTRAFVAAIPHELVSYALGLTKMNFMKYITLSTLGLAINSSLWYLLTLRSKNVWEFGLISILMMFGFAGIYKIVLKFKKRRSPEVDS
jgi:uncharacterized membrane protein YdjX (TVP38/TMEM64 family)